MLNRWLAYDLEWQAAARGDLQTVTLLRIWRYGRLLAYTGLTFTLLLIGIALAQVSGLLPRPMPVWVLVFDLVTLAGALLATWLSWRWRRKFRVIDDQ
jgi:hypothetical protein